MKYPHLIILYGRFGDKLHTKQQKMINGESTCMYRSFARKLGEIIYLCPQKCKHEGWDSSLMHSHGLLAYLRDKPDSIIWSVKHDPTGQKDEILARLPNKKVYYSCCSYNTINNSCDISLVDTSERVKGNAALWVKGKDPDYWRPCDQRHGVKVDKVIKRMFSYDYVMVGKRGDKNEVWFIDQLTKNIKDERSIVWVGGQKHKDKINKTHHRVLCTPFVGMDEVRSWIGNAKVGIILSEIPAEGFPQTFLEMTMCGVPVVYLGPVNKQYIDIHNCVLLHSKEQSIQYAETLLKTYNSEKCREEAIKNYSLEKSYQSILEGLGL